MTSRQFSPGLAAFLRAPPDILSDRRGGRKDERITI
jgi:hypothetical protein